MKLLKGNWLIVVLIAVLVLAGVYMIYNKKGDESNNNIVVHERPVPAHNGGSMHSGPAQDDMELLEPSDESDPNVIGYGPGTHTSQGVRGGAEHFMY